MKGKNFGKSNSKGIISTAFNASWKVKRQK